MRPPRAPSVEGFVKDVLDRGDRMMGFGHRVYRAEDPRARLLRRTAQELGSPRFDVAEELERVALAELHARKPDRVLATNVEFWSAVVLDVADVPPQLAPAMFACSRTAGWSAHILEQKRLEPARPAVGPLRRAGRAVVLGGLMELAEAAAHADALAREPGNERELATLRAQWDDELEAAARSADYRVRGQAFRAIGAVSLPAEARAPPPRARGRERGGARVGADRADLAVLRPPGRRQRYRAALNELAMRDPNPAVRRLAIACLRNGTADRGTIQLLEGIAQDDDDRPRGARGGPLRRRRAREEGAGEVGCLDGDAARRV